MINQNKKNYFFREKEGPPILLVAPEPSSLKFRPCCQYKLSQYEQNKFLKFFKHFCEFQGRFLDLTQNPSNVHVSIGGSPCNVTSVTSDSLHCTIPENLVHKQNSSMHLVEVSESFMTSKQFTWFYNLFINLSIFMVYMSIK